jgi:Ribbon-helix-helix protein, copG family
VADAATLLRTVLSVLTSCITIFGMDEAVGGVPVTEEQIEAWQNQAREGLDVDRLRGRGRPRLGKAGESPVIPVRMDEELLEALTARAEHDGVSRSEAIRAAVRAWTHAA